MKCPRCQAQNDDDARFCEDCGAPLELACPSCGQPVALSACRWRTRTMKALA
jgi:predicted amidophosphoribosyltransferase